MNKQLLISFLVMSLLTLNSYGYTQYLPFNDTPCYQESTNTTNQTGIDGNCNLNYTGTYSAIANYFYINYTKTINVTNVIWQVEHGYPITTYNITLPISCYNSTKVQLRIFSNSTLGETGNSHPECYNGTWIFIGTNATSLETTLGGATDYSYILWDGSWSPNKVTWEGTYENKWISNGQHSAGDVAEEAIYWIPNKTINYTYTVPDGTYGKTTTLTINLTKGANQSYTNADLTYNGTTYTTPTQIDYTDYTVFTQEITNTIGTGTYNYTWNITINDNQTQYNFTTTTGNHTVTTYYLNINFSTNTNVTIVTLNKVNTSYNNVSSINLPYTQFNSTELTVIFGQNQQIITQINYSTNETIKAYVISDATNYGPYDIIGAKSLNAPLEGDLIKIEKYYQNDFWTQYSAKTDSSGTAKVMVQTGENYRITSSKEGYTTKQQEQVIYGTSTTNRIWIQMTETGATAFWWNYQTNCVTETEAKTCTAQVSTWKTGVDIDLYVYGENGYTTSKSGTTTTGNLNVSIDYILNSTTKPLTISVYINDVFQNNFSSTYIERSDYVNITETNNGTISFDTTIPQGSQKAYILYGALLLLLELLVIAWGEAKKGGLGILFGTCFIWLIAIKIISAWATLGLIITIMLMYGYFKRMV